MHSKHIQYVKPDSETYLIQASIAGNLSFIEIYIKSQGDLVITDQQRRTGKALIIIYFSVTPLMLNWPPRNYRHALRVQLSLARKLGYQRLHSGFHGDQV